MQQQTHATAKAKHGAAPARHGVFAIESLPPEVRREISSVTKRLIDTYGSSSVESITKSELNGDLERLRVYEKLLPFPGINTQRLNIAIDFYRRVGRQDLPSFLTSDIVIDVVNVALAVAAASSYESGYLENPSYDPLALELLEHRGQLDTLLALMKERELVDFNELIEVWEEMNSSHSAINEGTL